ncbi:FG-GAP-like repeat-containing protein [Streptomyces sp. NPDC002889]|uniref:FG-GAP-like repeat-containing protein n=1 Tax=Streptomyces sp. NPDC002889 TaxID=3364669 RepID=UPI0036B5BBE8
MKKNLRTTLATAAAAALTGGLLAATSGTATAAPSGLQGDFNGDGYRDVAVSASSATVNGYKNAGAVTVLYGSAGGAGAEKIQTLTQNSAGVPGTAEAGDAFGSHLAAGDYNGDGYADLAVGSQREDVGSDTDGGAVTIVWGSATGLSGGTGVADPSPTSHDQFGAVVAAGDYNGDGKADLAISADNQKIDIYRGGFTKSGGTGGRYSLTAPVMAVPGFDIFYLAPGDVNKDGRTDLVVDGYEGDSPSEYSYNANYYLPGSASGLTTTGKVKLPAGVISDIGDANGDGYGDVVIGNSWDSGADSAGVAKGGAIKVVYGTSSGPNGGEITVHQDTLGVPGTAESKDNFGWEVSFGDINGDGRSDLAIGSPNEDVNGVANAGMVTVLYATETGFAETGNQGLDQDVPGVPGAGEAEDAFGGEVFLSDTNDDGNADLTVGIPWENARDGQIVAFGSNGTQIDPAGRSIGLGATGISAVGTPILGWLMTG